MCARRSLATPKAQKMPPDGLRVSPLIDHGVNENHISSHPVINGEREDPGKQAVETEKLSMKTMGYKQGINVHAYRVQEIRANARFLTVVKQASVQKSLFGLGKDYDFHALRIASSCLTRSQSS